eukprot:128180-Chlamydomonas_euryale.AAC.2
MRASTPAGVCVARRLCDQPARAAAARRAEGSPASVAGRQGHTSGAGPGTGNPAGPWPSGAHRHDCMCARVDENPPQHGGASHATCHRPTLCVPY